MKKFLETIKDILYDSIDYIIMAVIIVAVISVIGWRLDVLFANDALDIKDDNNTVIVDNSSREPEKKPDENVHTPDGEKNTEEEPPTEDPPKEPTTAVENIDINIPSGSLPGTIGSILQENGLISSSKEFIAKAVELKLDTRMKSGHFTIAKGSSIEEILQIITK